jgi:hypothetical protein
MHKTATSILEQTIANLDTGAIFFAMRSCEYNKVPKQEQRRTKLLCIRNFRFFKSNKEISISSKLIREADCVSITFESQKNDEKNETVTQQRSNDDILCPVKSWASTIQRIRSYPSSTRNTPINIIQINNKTYNISSKDNINFIRKTVKTMDKSILGFSADEVGTHSLRSGGAMAMKLSGAEDSTIRLIGRWKSDSFLKYIRRQVLQFSSNISCRMLENEHFTHIPSFNPNSSPSKLRMAPTQETSKDSKKSITESPPNETDDKQTNEDGQCN